MTKSLKTVKASIVMGILLISVIVAFIPSSSAAPLKSTSTLKLEYDASAVEGRVMPLGGPVGIPVEIGYLVSGIFAESAIARFSSMGVPATIDISVEETPSWVTAWVSPNVVSPEIKTGWNSAFANVYVSFKETAPARAEVKIRVKMQAQKVPALLFEIGESTHYADITFTPEYLPIISINPKGTFKEISPGQESKFEIEIENLGNAKTDVAFKIVNTPKGWSANIQGEITLESAQQGEGSKKTVILLIQPPYNFGYHNDQVDFELEITPYFFADDTAVGRTITERFTVRSRGFSTPGFEAGFVVFALMGVAFIFNLRRNKRK